jgi:UDP-N-acetylmuramoylalanine--D-glutamate ligase
MKGESFRGRRVLVVGLARSGAAAIEFLLDQGAEVRATDLKEESELPVDASALQRRGVELILGGHPPGLVDDVSLVVVSPGVPLQVLPLKEARSRGVPVWGELELAFRQIRGTVVAVTGTKGKSTTASLITEILKRAGKTVALGGNIGQPLISLTEQSVPGVCFVVEVSSFQLETTVQFRPHVGVLLDVTPDHLDWHPSFEDYVRAKQRIFAHQGPEDWAVAYGASPLTVDMANKARSRKVFFNLDCMGDQIPHVCVKGPWIMKHDNGEMTALISKERVPLKGRHNLENVLAAVASVLAMDVDPEFIDEALLGFTGIPHALEKIGELNGVAFYDDSKATNVAAAKAALASFAGGVFLILGGRYKGGDFRELRPEVERSVKRILAIGEAGERITRSLGDVVPVESCRDLREAVRIAYQLAVTGDTILLSPACASFDMFTDYAERGVRFGEEVEKLKASVAAGRDEERSKED